MNQIPMEHVLTLSLSDDKLEAALHFSVPDEQFKCSVEELNALLSKHHIIHGIHHEVLAKFAANPAAYLYDKVVIASGDAPQNGNDGSIKHLFELDIAKVRPAVLEDGRVDYREMKSINNVRKGQLIAEKIPPTAGIDGRAVTGEILFSRPGKDARFPMGKNVVCNSEQTALYAAIDGVVTKTERSKLNVFPIYEVNGDIDYRVGNIDFVGNVVIRGNVLPGFRIKADGDIRISGGVEEAEIIAGGSIDIAAGILGRNKGIVQAKGTIKTSFVQDGNVEAGEDVDVNLSIMHSQVRAGRNVICSGSKGLIVGGTVQAGEKITARTVGNSTSTVTILEVGVLPELRNELTELRDTIKGHSDNLDKTEKALHLLDHMALAGSLPPDKMQMRMKLTATKNQLNGQLGTLKERTLEIEKSLEDTSKAGVDVINTLYPGVRIVIGRYTRYIKDTASRVAFKFLEGEITMLSYHR